MPEAAAEAGGGELHFLSSCASGRITRMLLADVCGIGSMFSEIAVEFRELMKQNVNAIQQKRIVRDLSQRLNSAACKGGYASLLLSTYFAPTRSFRLCNTGHPPPLVYRVKTGRWDILKPDPPQGGVDFDRDLRILMEDVVSLDEYQQTETSLATGDMVMSFSNALTESRDTHGNILGLAGVLRRARQIVFEHPGEFTERLVESVTEEHDDNHQVMQSTLMLCRATETKVGLRDNLLAPFRLLGRVSDNTKLR